jgi:signal recognition particle subunit SRP19
VGQLPKENYVVLWPQYFDMKITRGRGRMVDRKLAVENPTAEEILSACESLGYVKKIEDGAFPNQWWKKSGKVVVERKTRKSIILKKVAQKIKASRGQ